MTGVSTIPRWKKKKKEKEKSGINPVGIGAAKTAESAAAAAAAASSRNLGNGVASTSSRLGVRPLVKRGYHESIDRRGDYFYRDPVNSTGFRGARAVPEDEKTRVGWRNTRSSSMFPARKPIGRSLRNEVEDEKVEFLRGPKGAPSVSRPARSLKTSRSCAHIYIYI